VVPPKTSNPKTTTSTVRSIRQEKTQTETRSRPVKLKLIIECVYEVPDRDVERIYGTTDPAVCAKLDEGNPADELLHSVHGAVSHRVEVA
jgi:hypothetical protein